MKYLNYFTIALITLTGYSCRHERKANEEFILRTEVKDAISAYIEKHPQFNTFFMQSTKEFRFEMLTFQSGFLLGPGYERIIEECKPIFYFDILDKRVFYMSNIDDFMERRKNEWVIENERDTVMAPDGRIFIKNHWDKFILRCIFFYYNEWGILKVNFEPDTLFFGKFTGTPIIGW